MVLYWKEWRKTTTSLKTFHWKPRKQKDILLSHTLRAFSGLRSCVFPCKQSLGSVQNLQYTTTKVTAIHIAKHLDFILYFALNWKSFCLLRNNETCHNNYEEDYSSIILVKPQLLPIHVNLWMTGCSMMSVAIFYIYIPSEVHYYPKPCSKKEVTCMFHHVCKMKN